MDSKNTSGTYAAVAGSTVDNQPEGTRVGDAQPPPYSQGSSSSGPGPSPSTQPPNAKPRAAAHDPRRHQTRQGYQGHARTPRHAEEAMAIIVAPSPEYYAAMSRAGKRFWGALLWALVIYILSAMIVGGGIEEAHRSAKRHKHHGQA